MFTYLVTAKHVADKAKSNRLFLRLNGRDGGIVFFRMPEGDHWFRHPENPKEVDVAVIPWWPPPEVVTFRTMKANDWCVSDRIIEKKKIGPGDEVFAVGLFTKMTGRDRNFPIVRTGHIAMMPDEKIPKVKIGDWEGNADAYLIESRSIGGWSGSPVFVRGTYYVPFQPLGGGENNEAHEVMYGVGHPYLLGLVHGHWLIRSDTINDVDLKTTSDPKEWNLGLTVVIPAHKIMEVLNQPRLAQMRMQQTAEFRKDAGIIQEGSSST